MAVVAVAGVLVCACAVTARLFLWPASAAPRRAGADAVVVFAGGRGERLSTALALVRGGVAPTLVISNGTSPGWDEANRLCGQRRPFAVLCPDPTPDTTRGEARMTAALAGDRGWRSVVLVTSTYHATRAGLLLRRCLPGAARGGAPVAAQVVAATPRQHPLRTLRLAVREGAASAAALVAGGDC